MSKHIESILNLIDQEIANTQRELDSINEDAVRKEISRMLFEFYRRKGIDMLELKEKEDFINKHSERMMQEKKFSIQKALGKLTSMRESLTFSSAH